MIYSDIKQLKIVGEILQNDPERIYELLKTGSLCINQYALVYLDELFKMSYTVSLSSLSDVFSKNFENDINKQIYFEIFQIFSHYFKS